MKPIIDRFVDTVQAARHDPSLDSRARRQQLATLREQYNTELDAVLTPDQQQKLASLKAQRIDCTPAEPTRQQSRKRRNKPQPRKPRNRLRCRWPLRFFPERLPWRQLAGT